MKVLRRKILLDDLKRFDDGVVYDTITATSIYMKVEMTQTIDDLGMVTNLPFIPNGAECAQFDGSIIVTNVTCYDPNSPAPSSAYINVTVYGGQAPYTYNFSSGTTSILNVTTNNTNYMLQNLAAGYYSVEVVDNLGCVVSLAGISENLSDVVTPTGYVILGVEYDGIPPGTHIPFTDITTTISVCEGTDVTLGINDYTDYSEVLWSTNETTETIQVTQSGNYSVQASNGDCFGGTPEVNIFLYSDNASQLESQLIIEPDTDVSGLQGDGTQQDPYILPCNPETTTTPRFRARLQSGVNPANFNCLYSNWHSSWPTNPHYFYQDSELGLFNVNQSQELIADPDNLGNSLSPNQCPPDNPCGIFLKSRSCGCTNTVLVQSNIIWVAYGTSPGCVDVI